jgi:ferric-dicitrate binding protein FerR (iron transport regulator)
MLRAVICWMLIAITPAAMLAADGEAGAAILYAKGTVWLNGKLLPRSSAVFPGDLIQTQPDSIATLDASGSGVVLFPDSLIKFEANTISLERGGASVATSKGMVALVRQVTVTPASNTWTEFEVADTNGKIQVFGSKGTVNVNCGKDTTRLSEGDEATPDRSGHCNKKKKKPGMPLPGNGPLLTNPFVVAGEIVTAGGVVCLLLCNPSKEFLSPWKP